VEEVREEAVEVKAGDAGLAAAPNLVLGHPAAVSAPSVGIRNLTRLGSAAWIKFVRNAAHKWSGNKSIRYLLKSLGACGFRPD